MDVAICLVYWDDVLEQAENVFLRVCAWIDKVFRPQESRMVTVYLYSR